MWDGYDFWRAAFVERFKVEWDALTEVQRMDLVDGYQTLIARLPTHHQAAIDGIVAGEYA